MNGLPQYFGPLPGQQLPASMLEKMQHDLEAQCFQDWGDTGFAASPTPFGTRLEDQRPKRFPAFITATGSGSGTNGTGSGGTTDLGTNVTPQDWYYSWEEAVPAFIDGVFQYIVKPNGLYGETDCYPAVEENQVIDVPTGALVWLKPGTGQPDFWSFSWTGEIGSGSNNDETLTISCGDGTTATYTISRTDDGYSATLVD